MFTVVITEKSGTQKKMTFNQDQIYIGRVQGNDIILPKGNVSKRHAKIILKDGKFIIIDQKSTNGTYVNGRKITAPQIIKPGDNIYIGDFRIKIDEGGMEEDVQPPPIPQLGGSTPQPMRTPTIPPMPVSKPGGDIPPSPELGEGQNEDLGGEQPFVSSIQHPQQKTTGPHLVQSPGAVKPEPKPISSPIKQQYSSQPPMQVQQQVPQVQQPQPKPVQKVVSQPAFVQSVKQPSKVPSGGPVKSQPVKGEKQIELYQQLLEKLHDKVIEFMDLRRLDLDKLGDEELWNKTQNAVYQIIDASERAGEIPQFVDRQELIKDILNEALGLGPLEDIISDDSVSEIMVNGASQIYVEKEGKLELLYKTFSSDKSLLGVIERIIAPIGRRIDESSPMVDARLRDGSRVNAIIPPLSIIGPILTIRKFKKELLAPQDLINYATLSLGMAEFLQTCVISRRNIIISGGTGSGKTTTLNVLSSYIPQNERIITIEDAAELQLPQEHKVSLETRPQNIEGKGEVTIRDLVRNALRMRPDRIIVGECRGGEALDMLQAMNTGHDGSMTTIHSNSPRDALRRLETLVLMSGMELPVKAIREQIASAIDIIVQETRFQDGSRKITSIVEVTGMEGDVITTQEIFSFQQEGFDPNGKVIGKFVATGFVPKFYEELRSKGMEVNMDIFR